MSCNAQSRRRLTGIWLLLLLLTAVSAGLGRSSGWPAHDPRDVGLLIVVVAFVKIRFIILDFMEVRYAPTAMRAACEAWVIAVCAAILILCRY